MLDLVVIGAGLAGLTAALRAAKAGLRVRVIAKGLGALLWDAGTLDLLGYRPVSTTSRADESVPDAAMPDAPVRLPLDTLADLPDGHPYRRLTPQAVRAALDELAQELAAAGLIYERPAETAENLLLPSAAGSGRPAWYAPSAQFPGRLAHGGPMLLVGFHGLRDFYPTLMADNLSRQGYAARAHLLPLSLITDRHDSNTVHLAEALEQPQRLEKLAAALREVVRPDERIGLPAILGLHDHAGCLQTLAAATEAQIFEIPTLPPSVPGLRLQRALATRLQHFGARLETHMEVTGFHDTGEKIEYVETATPSRPLRHRAQHYLLATGGILGGGFQSDHHGAFWESIFDLPLSIVPDRSRWFRPEFLDPAGQPIFQAGITVNDAYQPCHASGAPVYTNLQAAGNLLAHADTIRTRSHSGLAVATGTAAVDALLARHQPVSTPAPT